MEYSRESLYIITLTTVCCVRGMFQCVLQGNGKLIFQGCISYVACILISYLGFAMMRFGNIEKKYMRKLDGAAHKVLFSWLATQHVTQGSSDNLQQSVSTQMWPPQVIAPNFTQLALLTSAVHSDDLQQSHQQQELH